MCDMKEKTALVVEDHSEHYKRYAALLSGMGLRVGRSKGSSMYCVKSFGAGAEYVFGDADSLEKALRQIGENLPSFKAASRKMAEENFDAVKIYDEYVRFASAYV